MSNLKAAYLNEMFKLSKKKKLAVAAILSVFAVALALLIALSVNNFMGIRITGAGEFSVLVLQVLSYTLIPLFTAFVCIDMFCGEVGDETIKLTLTRPVSRFKIYVAKALAAASFVLANLIFVMLLSLIASVFIGPSAMSIGHVIGSYLGAFLPLMVFALMVMLVSNIVRGSTSAFFISIVIFLAFLGLQLIFPAYESFFYTSAFGWYTLFWGSFINLSKIIRILLILLGYGTAFFAAGYYLFERKQI